MRRYPRNSPQAAARVVALAVLADGQLSRDEIATLERLKVPEQLGLDGPGWHDVITALCQDMLVASHLAWADVCRIDARTLDQIMGEIDDPQLQRRILNVCVELIECDGDVADSESLVLVTAVEQWGLQHEMFAASAP